MIADSPEAVTKWRKDSSIPLVDVLDSYDIFVTNKHGSQGVLDRASKSQIENEFGTYSCHGVAADIRTKNEEAILQILKEGKVEETKTTQKFGI